MMPSPKTINSSTPLVLIDSSLETRGSQSGHPALIGPSDGLWRLMRWRASAASDLRVEASSVQADAQRMAHVVHCVSLYYTCQRNSDTRRSGGWEVGRPYGDGIRSGPVHAAIAAGGG